MEKDPPLPTISEASVARHRTDVDDESNNEELEPSPLWDREDEGWHLTWPIWHMLPHDERKELAKRHGYKTIGAFEEYMSLQQAVEDSETRGRQVPYSNASIYLPLDQEQQAKQGSEGQTQEKKDSQKDSKPTAKAADEDDEEVSDEDKAIYNRQLSTTSAEDALSLEELMLVGGKILMLHDEILHQVFSWLPVDAYGTLAWVSPHWKHLTRTEAVYRRLCERLYLNQSKRRQLHVSRFGGSFRRMLELRPRVRAAGGCYVLKYSSIKPIQRDMWTEVPIGAILETVYYRYLYFQEDGRVLYALTSAPPHQMFRRLLNVCLRKVEEDVAVVWGTYQVQKDALTISARQPWHTIRFELTIQVESQIYGRFGSLVMSRHLSSPTGCFEDWSNDRVEYKVPHEVFRFMNDPRL